MNILQIIHNHKFGGAEQHVISLCKGLRDAGHNVEVAAPKKSWIGQRLIEAGFIVHDFDFRGHYDLWAMARLTYLTHVMHYDIIRPLVVSCGNQRRQSVVVVAPCGHVGKSQSGLSTCPCGLVVHELEAVS